MSTLSDEAVHKSNNTKCRVWSLNGHENEAGDTELKFAYASDAVSLTTLRCLLMQPVAGSVLSSWSFQ